MILGVIENIQKVWNIISPYLAGITIGGIVSAFFYAVFSGSIKAFINKVNIEKIVDTTVNATMEQIKDVSVSVELKPLVENELKVITKEVNEKVEKELAIYEEKINTLILCFDKLATYFDNSNAIPLETKQDLHNTINQALNIKQENADTTISVKPIIIENKKAKKKFNNSNVR